jgi:hypothetical protein
MDEITIEVEMQSSQIEMEVEIISNAIELNIATDAEIIISSESDVYDFETGSNYLII